MVGRECLLTNSALVGWLYAPGLGVPPPLSGRLPVSGPSPVSPLGVHRAKERGQDAQASMVCWAIIQMRGIIRRHGQKLGAPGAESSSDIEI